MLKRKIINILNDWYKTPDKKALLLKGARQVGKTTIIREFAKKHYKNFIEINFEQTPLAKEAFSGNLDANTIILNLSSMGYGKFEKGNTLVFFDEIQSCPQARTAIKFLVEDDRFDFIESGSLLGINYKDVSSYPVGYEQHIDMYPLDFEEFLWGCGISEDVINILKESYLNITAVPEFIHKQIMERFHQYLIIGGMPEVVNTFVKTNDINQTKQIQSNIINSYRDDISKYAGKEKHLTKKVFDSIPEQLCKKDKRFVLSDLEKGASQRKYGDATEWLVDAGIAYFSFNTSAFELPFSFYEKRNLYKLFMHDIGLLSNISFSNLFFNILQGDISINEGALTENYVAAELKKNGKGLNYYDKKSKQELDFIFAENNKITVVEVKSGNNYKSHPSLNIALENYHDRIERTIVLSKFNVEKQNDIIYYPLYMTMFMR